MKGMIKEATRSPQMVATSTSVLYTSLNEENGLELCGLESSACLKAHRFRGPNELETNCR